MIMIGSYCACASTAFQLTDGAPIYADIYAGLCPVLTRATSPGQTSNVAPFRGTHWTQQFGALSNYYPILHLPSLFVCGDRSRSCFSYRLVTRD